MATAAGEDGRWLRGRGRWRLFAGIWLVYLAPAFHEAWSGHTGADRVLRLLVLAAFCYVYADLVARGLTGVDWLRWGAPAVLLAIAGVLVGLVGAEALGAVVYVVVAVTVLQPVRVAVPVAVAGTLLVGVLPRLVSDWREQDSWSAAGSVALGSLAAFGFTRCSAGPWSCGRRSRRCPGWRPTGSGCGSLVTCTTCSATR